MCRLITLPTDQCKHPPRRLLVFCNNIPGRIAKSYADNAPSTHAYGYIDKEDGDHIISQLLPLCLLFCREVRPWNGCWKCQKDPWKWPDGFTPECRGCLEDEARDSEGNIDPDKLDQVLAEYCGAWYREEHAPDQRGTLYYEIFEEEP